MEILIVLPIPESKIGDRVAEDLINEMSLLPASVIPT